MGFTSEALSIPTLSHQAGLRADANAQSNKLKEAVHALLADARRKEARKAALRQEARLLLTTAGAA